MRWSSVVDDVDAGLHPVTGAGGGHHGADGLGHATAATDDPAHVLGSDVDAKADAVARSSALITTASEWEAIELTR